MPFSSNVANSLDSNVVADPPLLIVFPKQRASHLCFRRVEVTPWGGEQLCGPRSLSVNSLDSRDPLEDVWGNKLGKIEVGWDLGFYEYQLSLCHQSIL